MTTPARVTWLFDSIGYNNKLLYMEPILKAFVSQFPNTTIFTCETAAQISGTDYEVKKALPKLTFKIGHRTFSLPSPSAIFKLAHTRPDLIVINEFGLLSFYAVLYRLFKRDVRVLLLVENDPLYLKYYGVSRNNSVYDLFRRFIGRVADKVLCNNEKTVEYLTNHLGIPASKIKSACYLTSSVGVPVKNCSDKKERLSLLFVGQLIPRKGLKHLLNAINSLSQEQRTRLQLDILGDGPDRKLLSDMIEQYGLNEVVRLHGSQPYESIGDFYGKADVFVLPTLGDYRALVGFEALSAGLSIVGSVFDGASSEIIEDGVNGFIVDPRDEVSLANKIQVFLDHPELVEKFGKESERIAKKYAVNVAASNLIEAAKECVADLKFGK